MTNRVTLLRLIQMAGERLRYGLRGKSLTPDHKRMARARLLYWLLIRRWWTELCHRCGGPVHLVFHAPDAVWETVTGNARSPGGEAGGGVLCPQCLDELYTERGETFLRWTCSTDDDVMDGAGTDLKAACGVAG